MTSNGFYSKTSKLLVFCFLLNTTFAYKDSLQMAVQSLENGDYEKTIAFLEKEKASDINYLKTKFYFLGIAHARNQNYDEAIKNFSLALKYKNQKADLYYELGQSLYAMNELKKAQKAFSESAKNGFKPSQSNYYIAHIAQLLEDHKMAKAYFENVIADKSTTIDLNQVSRLQLSETLLSMARLTEDTREKVEKHVLVQMKKAFEIKKSGATAATILKRIREIQDEFGLNPNKFINGKNLPKKRFSAYFSQTFEYNNNFTLTDDLPGNVESKADTFIIETEAELGYQFILKRRYTIEPKISVEKTIHTERDVSTVYSSDGYEITPSIDFSLAHKQFNNPATLYLNIDYDYKAEDRLGNKEQIFNNRTLTFELGNKLKYFSFGNTTFKLKRKIFTSYTSSLDVDTSTIAMDQLLIKRGQVVLFLFNYDMARYKESSTNDTNTLLLRTDWIWPSFVPKTTLNLALSNTWISYQDDSTDQTRGTETTLSPSMKFTRDVTKRLALNLEYIYTKNSSDQESSNYTSHLTTLELNYSY